MESPKAHLFCVGSTNSSSGIREASQRRRCPSEPLKLPEVVGISAKRRQGKWTGRKGFPGRREQTLQRQEVTTVRGQSVKGFTEAGF